MAETWFKCKGAVWCELFKVDLNHKYLADSEGVFVIWIGDYKDAKVLKVGSGSITKKLSAIKKDIAIQAFKFHGLFVSWTEVSAIKQKGMELFLINELKPRMQDSVPKAIPIKVNLPWEVIEED